MRENLYEYLLEQGIPSNKAKAVCKAVRFDLQTICRGYFERKRLEDYTNFHRKGVNNG